MQVRFLQGTVHQSGIHVIFDSVNSAFCVQGNKEKGAGEGFDLLIVKLFHMFSSYVEIILYCIYLKWGLSWDDENYYLVGFDSDAGIIKHYRVDKMLHIRMSEENRDGKEQVQKLDMASYAKKSFGMFGGEEQTVKLLMANTMAGVIIDRFGKEVMLIPADDCHFTVNVDVQVSDQFLSWIFALGEGAKIIGPEPVVKRVHAYVERLNRQYIQ